MIQRKQTLFLLVAAIALSVAAFVNTGTVIMLVILILSAVLSLADIFLYKQRKRQAQVTLFTMFLLVVWYILMAVENRNMAGSIHLVWSDALPLIAILMLFLARKGILADEKLVRSLDRIR